MNNMNKQTFSYLWLALICLPVDLYAATLQQVAQAALAHDSAWQASRQTSEADKQKRWQGLSGMLPTLTLEGSWERQQQPDKKYQSGIVSHSYGVQLSQPLFDISKYAGWRKGVAIATTAEAQARQAEEKLLAAVANAYFSVLYQQEVLRAAQTATRQFAQQVKQLRAGAENGLNTRTEVDEASANYAIAQAKEIEAGSQLLLAGEALRRLSGLNSDALEPVNFRCLNALPYPSLADALMASQQRNSEIRLATTHSAQADADVLAVTGAHLPVASLYAHYGKNWSRSDNRDNLLYDAIFGTSAKTSNLQYGVNVSMPLFAGGSQLSQSFEASHRREAAKYSLQEAQRKAAEETRTAWLGLTNGSALIDAQNHAVDAARAKVISVRYGRELGFRTVNDEMEAQQKYFTALQDLAAARLNYLSALVSLAQSTGALSLAALHDFQCR